VTTTNLIFGKHCCPYVTGGEASVGMFISINLYHKFIFNIFVSLFQ